MPNSSSKAVILPYSTKSLIDDTVYYSGWLPKAIHISAAEPNVIGPSENDLPRHELFDLFDLVRWVYEALHTDIKLYMYYSRERVRVETKTLSLEVLHAVSNKAISRWTPNPSTRISQVSNAAPVS